jgi:hypothetical protein
MLPFFEKAEVRKIGCENECKNTESKSVKDLKKFCGFLHSRCLLSWIIYPLFSTNKMLIPIAIVQLYRKVLADVGSVGKGKYI